MDISGEWIYKEDFEYGKSEGKTIFAQTGNEVIGTFKFTETVENNYKIEVSEKVKGVITNSKVILKSIEVTALHNNKIIDYLPNTFDLHLVSENKLVGSTFDSEQVCGVFVLERTKNSHKI